MKIKVIFYLLLLISCFNHSFAELDQFLVDKQISFLGKAQEHKKKAIEKMKEADSLSVFIPDLGKRRHMQVLISSSIGSMCIADPRLRIVTIGLSLIGDIAIESYDKYCTYKNILVEAAYHFEMENFYIFLSLDLTHFTSNEETIWMLRCIDCLTMCVMLSDLVEGYTEMGSCDLKGMVKECIEDFRSYMIDKIKESNFKLDQNLLQSVDDFIENFDEILSEADRDETTEKLFYNIYELRFSLENKIKCQNLKNNLSKLHLKIPNFELNFPLKYYFT